MRTETKCLLGIKLYYSLHENSIQLIITRNVYVCKINFAPASLAVVNKSSQKNGLSLKEDHERGCINQIWD